MSIAIAENMPWSEWGTPEVFTSNIHDVRVGIDSEERRLSFFRAEDERLGVTSKHALKELSTRVGFPTEFLEKLPLELQAEVINARIADARKQEFNFTAEEGRVTNIMPAWRVPTAHPIIAQCAYDTLAESLGGEVIIDDARIVPAGMSMRLITPLEQPITRAVGDVLKAGIEVQHSYGMRLEVSLFTERLVCLNGMTARNKQHGWSSHIQGDENAQLAFLRGGIGEAIESFGDLVARSQQMAETRYNGDAHEAIRVRARALGIPQRYWSQIIDAYELEPGQSEWALLNAFTRFATHDADNTLRQRLQLSAGTWVEGFDMVTARLPRPVANSVGARIIEQIEAEDAVILDV